MIRTASLAVLLAVVSLFAAAPPPARYDALRAEAERNYEEKSFSRAHELYVEAAKLELPADDRRWVRFRLADTAWRAGEDSNAPRQQLEELIRETANDRVWAEANESLGDLFSSQSYWVNALDYWAGSDDLDYARERYLRIVFKMAPNDSAWNVPRDVLVNAVAIAKSPDDRAHASYLLAVQLIRESRPDSVAHALDLLEDIIATGAKTRWYDEALFLAAQHFEQRGDPRVVTQYGTAGGADLEKALAYYRKLAALQSSHRKDAESAIERITAPRADLSVAGTFLPDSEQELILAWRNVTQVALAIHAIDLVKDVRITSQRSWLDEVPLGPAVRTWTFATNDDGRHVPGVERIALEPRLERGAYVVTAEAGAVKRRTLVLVSDTHILTHSARETMMVYVSDVLSGEPLANARVRIWQQKSNAFIDKEARADANGLARFDFDDAGGMTFIAASNGTRQAYLQSYTQLYGGDDADREWKVYAFTDRPAYRPGETVQWKMIARIPARDGYTTPAGESLKYEIRNARDEKVSSGVAKLSEFGTFSASLPLDASMLLGAYSLVLFSGDDERGAATLFRLEEYKLPEFLVNVTTPEGRQYRLGDTIEATVEASYYFGGPVANADVEVVVESQPLIRWWYPWRRYTWLYNDAELYDRYYGGNTIVKRETLKTDANGRATVRIDTPFEGADTSYRIEARVVDASRREVRGQGTVRVTRQRYSVMLTPEHFVHRPGDSVSIDVKALDANDNPVQTAGTITVMRGAETELTVKATTDAKGESTFTFTPKRDGTYVVKWTSADSAARDVITGETTIWVATASTRDLGYPITGDVNLLIDKDTMISGQTANVLVVTPASGRWIMLTTSARGLLDTKIIHLDGTVKLVQIPLGEEHVPNFFLTATSVFDRRVSSDSERIVVPPVAHFIDVDVKSDREQYQPRDEGTITVTTRDTTGKPVSAEVALSVSDEAVTAIQQELAGDPRQFFFGETWPDLVTVGASANTQRYVRLVRDKDGHVIDENEKLLRDQRRRLEEKDEAAVGGVAGGAAGYMAMDRVSVGAPPPAPPMAVPAPVAQSNAVSEAITVTGEAPQIDIQVRSDFRSTALWEPRLVTDANGVATIKLKYPEALTTWRATARAATRGSQFGMGTSTAKTSMPLIVRLQAPRFFVAGDHATISAVINNNTGEAMSIAPSIEVEGLRLEKAEASAVSVAANGEARVDWTVIAETAGEAKVRVTGRGAKFGDAMEKTYTVYEHGIDKLIARSGKLRGSEAIVKLDLPRERRATRLDVHVSTSIAAVMLDALPYLIDYPYGCTEQTMSRFLPAAIVARTIESSGGQAILPVAKGQAKGQAGLPVLHDVIAKSVARLYDMQHDNGAWGWWKESGDDAFMTAYVVWGFSLARDAGLRVDASRIDRAVRWLESRLPELEDDYSDEAWALHAMSAWRAKPSAAERKAFDDVYTHREKLTSYSRALLALAAHRYGEKERTAVLVRNLENGVKIDRAPDTSVLLQGETTAETMATAHWGEDRFWWRWYDGPVEATSFVLQALVTIDPQNKLIEPAMNWLVKNRRGTRWDNTRDTAIALLSINDYLVATGELHSDAKYEITVNGHPVTTSVDPSFLTDARQEIRIRRTAGTGPIYFSAEARFVSHEEPVKAAGNEVFVKREYFRLRPKPTLLKGVVYDRLPLGDNESVPSGERVEVVVTIETKNDYDYLLFEDLKPAGLEAVELRSGEPLYATSAKGNSVFVYQELRDRKVAMFADHLDQGLWTIRYTLRAETPGTFHALPLLGGAMYVPDVKANGDEVRLTVERRRPGG